MLVDKDLRAILLWNFHFFFKSSIVFFFFWNESSIVDHLYFIAAHWSFVHLHSDESYSYFQRRIKPWWGGGFLVLVLMFEKRFWSPTHIIRNVRTIWNLQWQVCFLFSSSLFFCFTCMEIMEQRQFRDLDIKMKEYQVQAWGRDH